jgi:hypothetical protein
VSVLVSEDDAIRTDSITHDTATGLFWLDLTGSVS